jgi:hypothetical protein
VALDESLAQRVERMLREHGVVSARLISLTPGDPDPGSEMATFELDGLLLRFVRERTEEYLDIGTRLREDGFHQFDDVAIAFGWTSVREVLNKVEPEPLDDVIRRVAQHLPTLKAELNGPQAEWTRTRIQRANSDRAKARQQGLR